MSLNPFWSESKFYALSAAAAAKLLQSCLTLCDPRDGSPPGSPVPVILQARVLESGVIAFSGIHVLLPLKWLKLRRLVASNNSDEELSLWRYVTVGLKTSEFAR